MRLARGRAGAAIVGCLLLGLAGPAGAQLADAQAARPVPRPAPDAAAAPQGRAEAGQSGDASALRVAPAGTTAPADPLAQAVLTVDQEAMYRQSAWGQRAERQIAQQSRQVAADNDKAFAALVADEDALTSARATLAADEFRKRAAAFDQRVMAVRQERDAARADLARMAERDRVLFFQAAAPVLSRVMKARGARVVLDQRTVLISDERIDMTAATIEALDSALGDGSAIIAAADRQEASAAGEDGAAGAGSPAEPASGSADGSAARSQDGAGGGAALPLAGPAATGAAAGAGNPAAPADDAAPTRGGAALSGNGAAAALRGLGASALSTPSGDGPAAIPPLAPLAVPAPAAGAGQDGGASPVRGAAP